MENVPVTEEAPLERYSRQMLLPQVGRDGQLRLKKAKVLVIGAGGLGTPVLTYLAAAGVGHLGVVDDDRIDITNLHRQVMFTRADVGKLKATTIRDRMADLNPNVEVIAYPEKLTPANAETLFLNYDLIVDATDNFTARYLISDTCVLTGKVNVSASIFQFEGQLAVYCSENGPCYRCVFPEPPPAEVAPSCSEAGVLGVLPGLLGTLQANEVMKIILGYGDCLIGRIATIDSGTVSMEQYNVAKSKTCEMCGTTNNKRAAYKALVARAEHGVGDLESEWTVDVEDVLEMVGSETGIMFVDVREAAELVGGQIPGSINVPVAAVQDRQGDISRDVPVIVYCETGTRSLRAVAILNEKGFNNIYSLKGGFSAWRNYAKNVDCLSATSTVLG